MGGLHNGHSQLIRSAKKINAKNNPTVLVSIFVNPLQFGPEEDFDNYPRNLNKDCETATQSGANAIWAPSIHDIFPDGINNHFQLKVPPKLQSNL